MALESATFLSGLVATNPTGSDVKGQGDDHIRLIKAVLVATFPNATRAFRFETVLTKTGAYPIVAADQRAVILANATSGAFTLTLPALSTVFEGWCVTIIRINSGANAVTVDGNGSETINGAANRALSTQYQSETYIVAGSEWKIHGSYDPALATTAYVDAAVSAAALVGEGKMWYTASAPTLWKICDGSAISRATYSALFAVIGTTYGVGDGSTTFNLPDLRGRVPVGVGTGDATRAAAVALANKPTSGVGGEESHVQTLAELFPHSHTYSANVMNGSQTAGGTAARDQQNTDSGITGGGSAFNIMQPHLGVNFIIFAGV